MSANKNSKIRFQNSRFRQQLKAASGYKRSQRKLPESKLGSVLFKSGLTNWKVSVPSILGLAGILYLLFLPNFLTIKIVEVTGLPPAEQDEISSKVQDYLNGGKTALKRNFLFVSKNHVREIILQDEGIQTVVSIKKYFPGKLGLVLEPRIDRYAILTPEKSYAISGDGLVTKLYDVGVATATEPSLIPISLEQAQVWQVGDRPLNQGYLDFVKQLAQSLPKALNRHLDMVQMSDLKTRDAAMFIGGAKVYFSFDQDLNKLLNDLSLLVKKVDNPQDIHYIDMRFPERAYVCFNGTPCSAETSLLEAASASTTTLTTATTTQQ